MASSSEEAYAGPAVIVETPPSHTAATSTTSPIRPSPFRPRRTGNLPEELLSTLTLSDGEISVSQYRVGGPVLCRTPADTIAVRRNNPYVDPWTKWLKAYCLDVLAKNGIEFTYLDLADRYWKADDMEGTTTVYVQAKRVVIDNSWFDAARLIRNELIERGIPDLNVEIADDRCNMWFSSPVDRNERAMRIWEPIVEPKILECLKGTRWLALELLRRGSEGTEKDPITVVVTVRERSSVDWRVVREAITEILDSNGLFEVAVEIVRGSLWGGLNTKGGRVYL